jgi:hypothetical protein
MHLRALALVAALLLAAFVLRPFGVGAVPSEPPSSGVVTATALRLAPQRSAVQNLGLIGKPESSDQKNTGVAGLPRLRTGALAEDFGSPRERAQ